MFQQFAKSKLRYFYCTFSVDILTLIFLQIESICSQKQDNIEHVRKENTKFIYNIKLCYRVLLLSNLIWTLLFLVSKTEIN